MDRGADPDWSTTRGERWGSQLAGMEGMLEPVDEPLIRALRLTSPATIADVGCGGGGTTLKILRRAPEGSLVHGYDISPALIAAARARGPSDDPRIAFALADVATTSPEQSYGRLLSRFGIMFFVDPSAAFANLARWLAPGGRFAFAVWGPPSENPWVTGVRDRVSEIIDLPPTDPAAPGMFRYGHAGELLGLLGAAGLAELEVSDWRGPLRIGGGRSASGAAEFAIKAFSSFGDLLAQAGEDAVEAAGRSLRAHFSRHEDSGEVRLSACVHIVAGVRPR